MKIEKINENQIRCTLTKEDLADRQIKISELAYGSEKAKSLFQDMIEQANYEFGFEVGDIPLMIEAIPLSGENIVLQITKVEYPEELDTRFSKFSEGEDTEESDEDLSLFAEAQAADDILDLFEKMKEERKEQISDKEEVEQAPVEEAVKKEKNVNVVRLFAFKSLEQMDRLSKVLGGFYTGENDVYKDEHKNRYYLIVRQSKHTPEEFNKVCNIISEYASYTRYSKATEAFLSEHGKCILKGNALQILETIQ